MNMFRLLNTLSSFCIFLVSDSWNWGYLIYYCNTDIKAIVDWKVTHSFFLDFLFMKADTI